MKRVGFDNVSSERFHCVLLPFASQRIVHQTVDMTYRPQLAMCCHVTVLTARIGTQVSINTLTITHVKQVSATQPSKAPVHYASAIVAPFYAKCAKGGDREDLIVGSSAETLREEPLDLLTILSLLGQLSHSLACGKEEECAVGITCWENVVVENLWHEKDPLQPIHFFIFFPQHETHTLSSIVMIHAGFDGGSHRSHIKCSLQGA